MNSNASAKQSQRPRKVPGASASTVQADVWNLCFAAITRARSGLSALFHTMLSSSASSKPAPEGRIWPMPLPFPEMHCRKSNRKQVDCGRKLGTNFLVLVLDWLAMSDSVCRDGSLAMGAKLSSGQWAAVRKLTPLVDSWNAHDLVDSLAMGRSASKVEGIETLLERLEQEAIPIAANLRSYMHKHSSGVQNSAGHFGHPGTVVGTMASQLEHVAKDLEPERLHFHGIPSFDPVPYLDNRNREHYQRPLDFACGIEELDKKVPHVRVRVTKESQLSLLEKKLNWWHLAPNWWHLGLAPTTKIDLPTHPMWKQKLRSAMQHYHDGMATQRLLAR